MFSARTNRDCHPQEHSLIKIGLVAVACSYPQDDSGMEKPREGSGGEQEAIYLPLELRPKTWEEQWGKERKYYELFPTTRSKERRRK